MRKLRNKKGFTLVEMLACIVILLLVGGMCNMGMNFAMQSYQRSVFESDSQMLEDTLNMYVGDILRHATDIEPTLTGDDADTNVAVTAFSNAQYQIHKGNIVMQEIGEDTNQYHLCYTSVRDGETYTYIIAGERVYAKTLCIDNWKLEYNASTGIFTGSYTIKSTILENASRECTFTFRTIASY